MPVDFPDIESVVRRVTKPTTAIIDSLVRTYVTREQANKLYPVIKQMPSEARAILAEVLEKMNTAAVEPKPILVGRGKYFRAPEPGESESAYRSAAADWMRDVVGDPVEASEIRTGRGWDRQSPEETLAELPGGLELAMLLRSVTRGADSRRDAE